MNGLKPCRTCSKITNPYLYRLDNMQACLRSCAKELGNLHGGILGPSGSDVELLREGELFREEVAEFWCVSPCALIETNCDDWEGGVLTPEVLVDV
ncbi:unnamed protein product [Cladocopium goreaui]|uniref:C3H1-type domain-containing protein n=1 Tax=Cladocopium goreaui TaxID=2562237 RepID=A0A9P1FSS5_9DINO|nr:unnamed protein product [Cladocopium goreaui]